MKNKTVLMTILAVADMIGNNHLPQEVNVHAIDDLSSAILRSTPDVGGTEFELNLDVVAHENYRR